MDQRGTALRFSLTVALAMLAGAACHTRRSGRSDPDPADATVAAETSTLDATSTLDTAPGPRDVGARDTGRPRPPPDAGLPDPEDGGEPKIDARAIDPCFSTSPSEARDLAGCNGGLLGPNRVDNDFGGRCRADSMTNTCVANQGCWGDPAGLNVGVCILPCVPELVGYTSTADCPNGSRCIPLMGGDSYCFPDCLSADDCHHGDCDTDGTCIGGGPPPEVPDAGASDAARSDGGP